jgi:hypothetical protein
VNEFDLSKITGNEPPLKTADELISEVSLCNVFRGNKQDAKTVGEFLACAIDHIRNGGNIATSTTVLADGTHVKLSVERLPNSGDEKHE